MGRMENRLLHLLETQHWFKGSRIPVSSNFVVFLNRAFSTVWSVVLFMWLFRDPKNELKASTQQLVTSRLKVMYRVPRRLWELTTPTNTSTPLKSCKLTDSFFSSQNHSTVLIFSFALSLTRLFLKWESLKCCQATGQSDQWLVTWPLSGPMPCVQQPAGPQLAN